MTSTKKREGLPKEEVGHRDRKKFIISDLARNQMRKELEEWFEDEEKRNEERK